LYYALHRPSSVDIGGNYIWLASSPDGIHWGDHKCLIKTREDAWDNARVEPAPHPLKQVKAGWKFITAPTTSINIALVLF
jgi:predicted GH43/DUF377 family glycosyl hydrolase